jgi:hypothetical protein
MRKLKLDVDTIRVESFALAPRDGREGTVRGMVYNDAGTWWWSCPEPTETTCIGPTYCCPETWRESCQTCPYSCPYWVNCGPV